MPTERCEECAFSGDRWGDQDVLTTLPIIAAIWQGFIDGADEKLLQTRPGPHQWSIAEYTDHVRETFFGMRFLLGTALTTPDTDLGEPPEPAFSPEPRPVEVESALEAVEREGRLLAEELASVEREAWTTGVTVGGDWVDLRWIGRHAVHDSMHHLHDIGRIRARLGGGASRADGTVAGLHRSGGGVPKQPVEIAEVDWCGVVGDEQNDRRHHGRPFQALCLWSVDVIAGLVEEGHPIFPGAAGENITIGGIDWATMRPGTIVLVGDVVAEISSYATPCAKNAQWFVDREFTRMDQELHPGWSRLYARVLRTGRVGVGDQVEIEPAGGA